MALLKFASNRFLSLLGFRLLVEQLERVDLSVSENSVKLAFWINVYNSLIMHVMMDICSTATRFFYAFKKNFINLCVIHLHCRRIWHMGFQTAL